MKKQALLFVTLCLSFWGAHRFVTAQEQSDSGTSTPGAEVATLPASPEQVMQTWRKRGLKLLDENPDVLGVAPSPATGEIIVETDRPDRVPKTIDGVPIKVRILKLPPPPPGVIVLRPGGVVERCEDLEDCPEEFTEHQRYR